MAGAGTIGIRRVFVMGKIYYSLTRNYCYGDNLINSNLSIAKVMYMKAYLPLRNEQVQNNFGKTYIYKTKVETNILGFYFFIIYFNKLIFRMAKVVKNDLGYLGIDFQYRLIGSFINEPNFFFR